MDYKYAIDKSRYWWNRHNDLPWWRPFAKRYALRCAEVWGSVAKAMHTESLVLESQDVRARDTSQST